MQIRSSAVEYLLTGLVDGNWPFTLLLGIWKIYPSGDRSGQPAILWNGGLFGASEWLLCNCQLTVYMKWKLAISDCGMNTLALSKLLAKVFDSLVGISPLRAERSCCSSTLICLSELWQWAYGNVGTYRIMLPMILVSHRLPIGQMLLHRGVERTNSSAWEILSQCPRVNWRISAVETESESPI